MTAVFLGLRWILAMVWLISGAAKLREVNRFATSLGAYGVLPDGAIWPAARALPVAEVALGIALAVGILPQISGLIAVAALVSFAGAMSWNLARGRQFDCGCGIGAEVLISWRLVGRNILLAGVATAVALGPSGGLAMLRGGASLPAGAPGYQTLMAVPMIVILLAVISRVLARGGLVQTLTGGSSAGAKQTSDIPSLAVLQVGRRTAAPARAK